MQIHELKLSIKRRNTKRIGRGGKRGTYSGRGQKGQGARAGHKIRPAERDLYMRLPKLRGVKNKFRGPRPIAISVKKLEAFSGMVITKKLLVEKGFVKNEKLPVKILGNEKLVKPIKVQGVAVSGSAKKAIEAAGGAVS